MSHANRHWMRTPLYVLGTATLLLLARCCLAQNMEEARRIQAKVLGFDTHNDTAQRVLIDKADIGQRLPDGMVDLPRLQEGGIHVPFFALWVPSYYPGAEAVRRFSLCEEPWVCAVAGHVLALDCRIYGLLWLPLPCR